MDDAGCLDLGIKKFSALFQTQDGFHTSQKS